LRYIVKLDGWWDWMRGLGGGTGARRLSGGSGEISYSSHMAGMEESGPAAGQAHSTSFLRQKPSRSSKNYNSYLLSKTFR